MKIHKVTIENFRGYKESTTINFSDLTAFVGRNDIGKSTVLEALDLFFNDGKGVIKYDEGDINISRRSKEYSVSVVFSDVPETVIVDSTYETSLSDEYLLNTDRELEIVKKFNGKKCTRVFIRAYHPTNENCSNLLLLKKNELTKLIQQNGIPCDNLNINSIMRNSIWTFYKNELQLSNVDIDVTEGEDTKKIWAKISSILPTYFLFQSDRQNSDKDAEIQDPLKTAVAQFFKDTELQQTLNRVAEQVEQKLKEVSERTLSKLREMDPDVADSLKPVIPSVENLKWAKVFDGVSLAADEDIPINKRGSGVKRLILLNFFRAEAERKMTEEGDDTGIIYAIEEPETSQHFANQKILADALIELSKARDTQVIFTTHSGVIVKRLNYDNLRLIKVDDNGDKIIIPVLRGVLVYPSMNEVNYIAFGEVTEEYHDELYGFIDGHGWLSDYENGKTQRPYIRVMRDNSLRNELRTLTHYIRDVQHHPENTNNLKYTDQELAQSIKEMRSYIETKNTSII